MIEILLVILIILWFLGYVSIPGFLIIQNILLFSINGRPVTLWSILILIILSWIVGILPRPFREIATILGILWILSVIGILAIGGFSQLFIIAIIFGLVFYIFSGRESSV